ncbi:flagellar biosynthetic protein FliO [Halomonas sp. MCCC 1A17488]|uniref:Flagellar protein n=1 Tax=Billgrantia sulfidoxydans TaxID=2733484 RepID=A0ABX7W568_9GAMM|nr:MULTISPECIES: flagellar biosynthetic protein FliO [Halomonas]MCE8014791.1 flagellar biosynthetic protein FliO [Halomonas sp. MCCC 1A17488]MCG3238124.1 flagellar biosynthetic protein FliO [Halomonas sp. MCCC 1A17488]QPP48107.1 flagellar biosynthetic protein FliO [Halomonas sp. SS10-MC5]QTP55396.1 flagellar biosynthetic protein FliO [Halomonas sulfidoxydans]
MSNTASSETASGLESLAVGGDALVGMATLGKTAAALALVIAIIFICTALLRRWNPQKRAAGGHLQVIGSAALGNRERVVIVEVEGTWLVLGVGGGQINKLHELAAPARPAGNGSHPMPEGERFAARFARALKHNAGLGGRGRGDA